MVYVLKKIKINKDEKAPKSEYMQKQMNLPAFQMNNHHDEGN